jgi:hypothetical protein
MITRILKVAIVISFLFITVGGQKFDIPFWLLIFFDTVGLLSLEISLMQIFSVIVLISCLNLCISAFRKKKLSKETIYIQISSIILLILYSIMVLFKPSNQNIFLPITTVTFGIFLLLSIVYLARFFISNRKTG